MNHRILVILKVVAFIICIALLFIGKNTVGKLHLGIMLIGLAGLLGLLYDYNRKYS
ncbi:DUF6903 family protein [Heyndrickxia vini]|uniref:Uncharacterized protein n=1 Tax=Heyndrickxia vini TaxID=1476025 RepID=A0ABX7E489_9BACI|nr:hypothetical protein [Heyndrickxia vini]QQZ10060.1 hypothetical protein I5776_03595 [Heyndrickxia vini]